MKIQLAERYLNEDIPNFLKESLASHYREVLTFKEHAPSVYIKFLAYHAIAYFQYLNSLNVADAINLYKNYILSDGKITSFEYNKFEIPLKFDDLLKSVSQTLMKYKDIVKDVTIYDYISHFRYSHDLMVTYITLYNLLDTIKKIGLNGIATLRIHWTIVNKEFIPYLLKNLKISSIT
jgi:hypothetical protein